MNYGKRKLGRFKGTEEKRWGKREERKRKESITREKGKKEGMSDETRVKTKKK